MITMKLMIYYLFFQLQRNRKSENEKTYKSREKTDIRMN